MSFQKWAALGRDRRGGEAAVVRGRRPRATAAEDGRDRGRGDAAAAATVPGSSFPRQLHMAYSCIFLYSTFWTVPILSVSRQSQSPPLFSKQKSRNFACP